MPGLARQSLYSHHDDAVLAGLATRIEVQAWRDMLEAAPAWVRLSLGLSAQDIGGALVIAARGTRNLLLNRVIGLGAAQPATLTQLDQIMNRYWSLGVPSYWIHVSPFATPSNLARVLQRQGLKPYPRSWVKMVRPAATVDGPVCALHIRPAVPSDAPLLASIVGPAFDLPQNAAELFASLIERRRWRVFVAESAGEVVAAAGLFVEHTTAYLAFAATRPAFRAQGAQRALMQARINAAAHAGCQWLVTETGFPLAADEPNPSYHNMLWAGFRPVAISDIYAPAGTCWEALA